MVIIKNKLNGQWIGSITEAQLQFLVEALEEEYAEDKDYWLNAVTIDTMAENGADVSLIDMLRTAMGNKEELEIVWSKS